MLRERRINPPFRIVNVYSLQLKIDLVVSIIRALAERVCVSTLDEYKGKAPSFTQEGTYGQPTTARPIPAVAPFLNASARSAKMDEVTARDQCAQYKEIVAALCERFSDRLKAAVLFGSAARGEARRGSDHDLLVLIDGLPRDPVQRQRIVREPILPLLPDDVPGVVNFVAKTPGEMEANLTPLLLDVCVDGLCLYGDTYFQPYRNRALAALRDSGIQRRKVGGTWMWIFPQLPSGSWELSWEGYRERA